ncbi:hypothetical protein KI387_037834, partial [Taxus chinensis]
MQNTPLVKTKFDVPTEDDSDELDDGENLDPPQANGIAKKLPKWYTQLIRDANLDEAPSISSNPGPRTRSQAREEVNYALMSRVVETIGPSTIQEALQSKSWKDSMDSEYRSVMKNNTWQLVDLPPGKKPIGCRWIFKTKYKSDGTIDKYKARLVAKGYAQQEGIDYEDTFAPTAKIKTIRMIFTLAAQF